LGFIPGGKIEIVSLDPQAGGVYYIFPIPRNGEAVRIERSTRWHELPLAEDTGYVPGLVVKSVVPGPTGGSLQAFRQGTERSWNSLRGALRRVVSHGETRDHRTLGESHRPIPRGKAAEAADRTRTLFQL
jgi:hypothetical protein